MGGKRGKFAENEKNVLKNTKKLQKNKGKKWKTWKKMRKIVDFEIFLWMRCIADTDYSPTSTPKHKITLIGVKQTMVLPESIGH